ncbi:prolipoprotein diacylglyceryl transferase [Sphaerochaeta sp. PS]|uniref:prolipoprotein diacylglyceryl transferase n=1 Tax=Sphaerochaeta sp. PS TaxID=3076336 RepID=UPI0028A52E38|nr:prolipoprotein diacylglyceryl transferase [Sphaerochaeta sp. PS]MDT4762475.1 prolipoprotein diacylglyceryl transferase [Sphaerochaeta sp. PS]
MTQFFLFPGWISPEIIPGLPLRWYGFMYVVAFAITYALIRVQARKQEITLDQDQTLNLVLACIIGLVVGARLFSVLFYDGSFYYWTHPWMIFWPFRGRQFIGLPGMSYHGGLVGAAIGAYLFSRKNEMPFLELADTVCYSAPLGYTFGRLGNFINGELFGRVSTRPWALVFPDAPHFSTNYAWVRSIADSLDIPYTTGALLNLPRHPSQLYEALFEGVVLFLLMWFVIRPRREKQPHGFALSLYLMLYGLIRFVIEYFRAPDENLGYMLPWGKESDNIALFQSFFNISMGQLFCLSMILAGLALFLVVRKTNKRA